MKYRGNIDAKHNTDGSMYKKGQGEEIHICTRSWSIVDFSDGPGAMIMGNEAILARCPNPNCQATDLKVVDVTTVV